MTVLRTFLGSPSIAYDVQHHLIKKDTSSFEVRFETLLRDRFTLLIQDRSPCRPDSRDTACHASAKLTRQKGKVRRDNYETCMNDESTKEQVLGSAMNLAI